ncbi:MAG: hypothetical protein MJ246_01550 [Clostridia bacterium]|nr:hypothetical protein [Clostridia bacterium]
MGKRLSTTDEMFEALIDLIAGIEEKMEITPPGTDYYVDLERQKEEFERQLAELTEEIEDFNDIEIDDDEDREL